jgi:nicotinamidase-related amidase
MIPALARLLDAARAADIPVIHCLTAKRSDMRGSNHNARLFAGARRSGALQLGTPSIDLIPEAGPHPTDILEWKLAGMSPFRVTGLDPILRNLGADTIILAGVSVNVAIPSMTFDAINRGYRIVIPRDAVAGVPPEYVAQMLEHTLSLVADITTTDDVIRAFSSS